MQHDYYFNFEVQHSIWQLHVPTVAVKDCVLSILAVTVGCGSLASPPRSRHTRSPCSSADPPQPTPSQSQQVFEFGCGLGSALAKYWSIYLPLSASSCVAVVASPSFVVQSRYRPACSYACAACLMHRSLLRPNSIDYDSEKVHLISFCLSVSCRHNLIHFLVIGDYLLAPREGSTLSETVVVSSG